MNEQIMTLMKDIEGEYKRRKNLGDTMQRTPHYESDSAPAYARAETELVTPAGER